MKTIGEVLKSARLKKRYSLKKIEDLTKIKRQFVNAIEGEDWALLPAFSTVLGFVKSLAAAVDVSEKSAVAILKRDYPPKPQSVNPKPDVSSKFVWSPKFTFSLGVGLVIVLILGYLVFQYSRFISPPILKVDTPQEGQVIKGNVVVVLGHTDSDAKVTANNQPVILDQDGKFNTTLEILPETKEIEIKSISRSGKETTVKRRITVEPK